MESKNFFINKNFAPLEISTTKQAGIIVLDTYSQERNKYVLDLVSKVKSFGYDLDAIFTNLQNSPYMVTGTRRRLKMRPLDDYWQWQMNYNQ